MTGKELYEFLQKEGATPPILWDNIPEPSRKAWNEIANKLQGRMRSMKADTVKRTRIEVDEAELLAIINGLELVKISSETPIKLQEIASKMLSTLTWCVRDLSSSE